MNILTINSSETCTGPIAEQSKSSDLDRGQADQGLNPGKGWQTK